MRAVDWAGDAHAHPQYARPLRRYLRQDFCEQVGCDVERSSGLPIYVKVIPAFGQHVVGEVRDSYRHVAVAEVDTDHHMRGIPKHQLHARPPAMGVGGLGVDVRNQTRLLQLRHQGRHGRPRKTGGTCDISLADLAVHPENLHHALAVATSEPGKGPVSIFRTGHSRHHGPDPSFVKSPNKLSGSRCR